jgi:hypothetical protein
MSDGPGAPADPPGAGPAEPDPAETDPGGGGQRAGGAPVLAPGWKHGCGLTIMIFGILLTALSGLCTAGMTIMDLSGGGGGGGDVNLSGVQYVFGGPFILIGALLWWGGWALGRVRPAAPGATPPTPGSPPERR